MTDPRYALSSYDYELPEALIAQEPAQRRDASRLMVVGAQGPFVHSTFDCLGQYLRPGDLLVINQTKVIPARLRGRRESGGRVELLPYKALNGEVRMATRWLALAKPAASLRAGTRILVEDQILVVCEREGDGVVIECEPALWGVLQRYGELPLPPYIRRDRGPRADDLERYQALFACEPGAVAAPTASLHFSGELLAALARQGVGIAPLILHVGPGTFLPVRSEHAQDVRQHPMHAEFYDISEETIAAIQTTKRRGGRVVAVGTTSLRALESYAKTGVRRGESSLFVYPGFAFEVVDGLITNFHLPRSTLLMLVSALAGHTRIMAAYAEAVRERYRFFSYGDAMFVDGGPR